MVFLLKKKMFFGIVFFKISHHKVFSPLFIALIKFWFGLILSFVGNRNLSLYQSTIYMTMNLNVSTNCLSNKLL